jgi:hypothetical protein
MTHYFDEHAARYLFFAPGEEVRLTISEQGPHALARISSTIGLDSLKHPRSLVFKMPTEGAGFMPVHVDAAFSGTMEDFLGSKSQVNVEFKGSTGTRYVQALRPQGGTGRWTYLAIVREPNARWYLCSTPCMDWKPTKTKPKSDHCPFCKGGIIVAVDF